MYKQIRYAIDEPNMVILLIMYSNMINDWIKLAAIKPNQNGNLTIYFFGANSHMVHFCFCDDATEIRQDIMQFVHCEFEFVNDPDDFDELINSWKLMAEINRLEAKK